MLCYNNIIKIDYIIIMEVRKMSLASITIKTDAEVKKDLICL